MADIKTNASTGLISTWLTDSSGLTTDLHGSNDLTNTGVTLTTDLQGDAGDFERTENDYLSITDASQTGLDFSTAFTLACYWTPESNPNDQQILWDKWDSTGNNRSYRILANDNDDTIKVFLSSDGAGGGSVTTSSFSWTYSTATRYWICVTYNAGTVEVFIDNSSLGTDSGAETSIYNSSTGFFIGGRSDGTRDRDLDGIINQPLAYNTEISSGFRSTIYNGGSGIPYEDAGGEEANAIFFGANF